MFATAQPIQPADVATNIHGFFGAIICGYMAGYALANNYRLPAAMLWAIGRFGHNNTGSTIGAALGFILGYASSLQLQAEQQPHVTTRRAAL